MESRVLSHNRSGALSRVAPPDFWEELGKALLVWCANQLQVRSPTNLNKRSRRIIIRGADNPFAI